MSPSYETFDWGSRFFVAKVFQDTLSIFSSFVSVQTLGFRGYSDNVCGEDCCRLFVVHVTRKGPVRLPSMFSFLTGALVTLCEESFADGGPAASVTERCVMGEGIDWFILLGDLNFLIPGLLVWLSQ